MLRLAVFLIVIAAAAAGFAWLADRPGEVLINWEGYEVRITVFFAIVVLAVMLFLTVLTWSVLRGVWQSPAAIGNYFNRRREKRGLEALSSGMIAIGAGDKALATRYAIQARKSLPNEPMTHLLRAQAARLAGDQGTARRIFEAMLSSPDTEQLGLRGLFLEAEKEGEPEAAKQFAERAIRLNPKLSWAVDALFDLQCKEHDWRGALDTLAVARKNGHIEKTAADRKRAVVLTAQAQAAEDTDPERAMNLALEAHGLAPDLIPAAAIAGRLMAARGNTGRATKVLAKTWKKAPHPELAIAYAYARLGDSPKDRLQRVVQLTQLTPNVSESPIALANAAIEARDFAAARKALEPLIESRLTQRVCTLMARIEGEDGNTGGVREWLARAVNAPRDPAWTADGIVADDWAPVSPVTGALDAFQWRVPVEAAEPRDSELLASKIEELVALGARPETMLAATAAVAEAQAQESETQVAASATAAGAGPAPAAAAAPPITRDAVDAEVVDVGAETPAQAPKPAELAASSAPAQGEPAVESEAKAVGEPAPAATAAGEAPSAAAAAPAETQRRESAKPASAAESESSTPAVDAAKPAEAAETLAPDKTGSGAAKANGVGSAEQSTEAAKTLEPVGADAQKAASRAAPDTSSGSAEEVKAATRREADRSERPKVVAGAGQPAGQEGAPEPKIFVSPRAPDDPGPRSGKKA